MGTETQDSGGQQQPTAPGKPASRQPPDSNTGTGKDRDEGQEIPKTGRDPSEAIEQDISNDTSTDDVDEDETDEDEVGSIELPGQAREGDRLDGSGPAGNP